MWIWVGLNWSGTRLTNFSRANSCICGQQLGIWGLASLKWHCWMAPSDVLFCNRLAQACSHKAVARTSLASSKRMQRPWLSTSIMWLLPYHIGQANYKPGSDSSRRQMPSPEGRNCGELWVFFMVCHREEDWEFFN